MLDEGRYGELFAVEDVPALAFALQRSFDSGPDRKGLRERALAFSAQPRVRNTQETFGLFDEKAT